MLTQSVSLRFPISNQLPSPSTVADIVGSAVSGSGELEEATTEVTGTAVVSSAPGWLNGQRRALALQSLLCLGEQG